MEEVKAIAKFVEGYRLQDFLREIYGDAAKSGAKQVGKALETVFRFGNTLLLPLVFANDKARVLRENMEKYREKLRETPTEDICEVPPEIGVPITEKLGYVTNEELSNMYVELLAKASQVQHSNLAHPSFVNIINNISPDEAVLIRSVKNGNNIPFVEARLAKTGDREFSVVDPLAVELPCFRDLAYPTNIPAYFSNLEGLGIVDIRTDRQIADENVYEPIEATVKERYSELVRRNSDREIQFERGTIGFTKFGYLFLRACFQSNQEN